MRKYVAVGSQLEDLLEAYSQGDCQAFDTFFNLSKDPLYSFVRKKTQNAELAADIVQDVYLRIHRHILRFDRNQGSALNWIFSIAHNCVRDAYLQSSVEKRRDFAVKDGPHRSLPEAEARIFYRDLISELKEYVSEEDLDLLLTRVLGEASFEEIGAAQNIKAENARQRFSRLLRKLKLQLRN